MNLDVFADDFYRNQRVGGVWAADVYGKFCAGLSAKPFANLVDRCFLGDGIAVYDQNLVAGAYSGSACGRIPHRFGENHVVAMPRNQRSYSGIFSAGERQNLVLVIGGIILRVGVYLVKERSDSLVHDGCGVEGVDVVCLQFLDDGTERAEFSGELFFLGASVGRGGCGCNANDDSCYED